MKLVADKYDCYAKVTLQAADMDDTFLDQSELRILIEQLEEFLEDLRRCLV